MLVLAACGGGGGGSTPAALATYNVSGNVNGFSGINLAVELNGASPISSTTGSFTGGFAWENLLVSGQTYAVTVSSQPLGATCTVANGTGVITDANVMNVQVNCSPTVPQTLAPFAGNMSTSPGNTDGTGPNARFNFPYGVATDSAGNTYVADSRNRTIRKITPAGLVTSLAGNSKTSGSIDGTGAAASFSYPVGIATDSVGNLYVTDGYGAGNTNNYTIRKITPAGIVTTLAGVPGVAGFADGTGAAASFNGPTGIATDSAGNVYVADTNNSTIRKITPAGTVTTVAGTAGQTGSADGSGVAARFSGPQGIATDSFGNLYVADSGNNTIRKIAATNLFAPVAIVTTLAGTAGQRGSADGSGAAASFNHPYGIATDSAGNIYVGDSGNYTVRKITPTGVVTTLAGTAGMPGPSDGIGAAAQFGGCSSSAPLFCHVGQAENSGPNGVATDSAGDVYVADTSDSTIRKISPAGVVTTLAGVPPLNPNPDGTGVSANFNAPQGLAADSAGNIYVADTDNFTIRKITPTGVVSTLAGMTGSYGNANGNGSSARFGFITLVDGLVLGAFYAGPAGLATDSSGNVYVVDAGNFNIRVITPAGGVTTLAGPGATDSLVSAIFKAPFNLVGAHGIESVEIPALGIATDSSGNVYVANTGNNVINKINPAGVLSVFAGSGSPGSADGTGVAASFKYPYGIAIDNAGNLYVTDSGNGTVRKITPGGVVTTLAGTPGVVGSADGVGAAASFSTLNVGYTYFGGLSGVAIDRAGNLFVADTGNNTVRKITQNGAVTTFVGVAGQAGFQPGALPGLLTSPIGVVVSGTSLYISTANMIVVVNDVQ